MADLDSDGHYDLILSYHNRELMQIYFGKGNGRFALLQDFKTTRRDGTTVYDIHGVQVAQKTAQDPERILAVSVGGGTGSNLKRPLLYLVGSGRRLKDISKSYGFGKVRSRGRNTVFMDLAMKSSAAKRKNGGGPDVLFVNFLSNNPNGLRQYAYENVRGYYNLRKIPVFDKQWRGRVEVTDIDGDGIMELISIRALQIYKLVAPFRFAEVTAAVLPPGFEMPLLTGTAVVEFDMDNDGDMDLYVARADRRRITSLPPVPGDDGSDYLFENRGGRYVDVSAKAGIRRKTDSMGVTTGDFNNDGYTDVFITTWKGRDFFLLNQGDGTFKTIIDDQILKPARTVGNNAMAVDYNLDGRVDLIVGQGDIEQLPGYYRLMRSKISLNNWKHYLLVYVGNEPSRGTTSLHAVVTVVVGKQRMTRRIGSRGAQGGGGSYLDTVHFGLGRNAKADVVIVRWTNGVTRSKSDVEADQKISFGVR